MTETEKKVRQDKYRYFQQIAGKRLDRILDALDALGNCSAPVTYDYSSEDLPPMFTAIMKKLDEVRQRLVTQPLRLRSLPFASPKIDRAGWPQHQSPAAGRHG